MTTRIIDRVEDTARWVAAARARESERADRVFEDPFARRVAGEDGDALAIQLCGGARGTWPIVARTYLLDHLVLEAIAEGVDAVLNLAAGYDSRPLRLALPPGLTWIEVDFPHLLETKQALLRDAVPRCLLERVPLDLADAGARRVLFDRTRQRFSKVLVITEGLLCYLAPDAAVTLGRDLLDLRPFRWVTDLNNGAVNRFIAERTKHALAGTATMTFGPDDGTAVFEAMGWRTLRVDSMVKTASRIGRLSFPMSWLARLPEPRFGRPGYPWTGVCVLAPGG